MTIETAENDTLQSETLKILRQMQRDIAEIKANQRASHSILSMPAVPETEEELLQMLIDGEESGISDQTIPDILADMNRSNA